MILGRTVTGRATVVALSLNNLVAVTVAPQLGHGRLASATRLRLYRVMTGRRASRALQDQRRSTLSALACGHRTMTRSLDHTRTAALNASQDPRSAQD